MSAQGGSAPQDVFDVAIADGVAHLKLNRPDKLNSMNRAFWNELPAIVRDIDDNAKARVIVISSTGKHFSAGMDLDVFAENGALASGQQDPHVAAEAFRHLVLGLQGTFSCLDEARMPVIAAIQGGCIGGAVDMTSACDIRYCTADAFFCIQEINLAMTADVGTFPRLCKLIPEGWVRELAYTGRRLPAEKAKAIGLVNEVYPDHAAMMTRRDGDGARDRGQEPAGRDGLEGDDQLRPRPRHQGGAGLHRAVADRHVRARAHGRGLQGAAGEAHAALSRSGEGAEGAVAVAESGFVSGLWASILGLVAPRHLRVPPCPANQPP